MSDPREPEPFSYSILRSATDTEPRRVDSDWSTFVERLAAPSIRGNWPLAEYLAELKAIEDRFAPELAAAEAAGDTVKAKEIRDAWDKAAKPFKDRWKRQKDGAGWIPGTFRRGGRRTDGDVMALHAFVGDSDGGLHRNDIGQRLNGFRHAIHSSYTHNPGCPKYRLVIPYSQPLPPAHAEAAFEHFNALLGGKLDPSGRAPSHLYYLPACPPDAAGLYECFVKDGDLFDVEVLKGSSTKIAARPLPDELPHVDVDTLPISHAIKELIRKGGRAQYASRSEAAFAVVLALIRARLDDAHIAAVLLNPQHGISERPREKGAKWLMGEIARARAKGGAGATGGAAGGGQNPETRTWPVVVDIADFLAREFPPRDNVLAPWLPVQGLAMVYGWRGVGKTWVGLNVAYAVASGGEFLGWQAPEPRGVLYLDGEMPAAVLQERLARIVASVDQEALAPLRIITPDLQPNGMPDLAGEAGQIAVNACIDSDIGLIVVDNLSTLARGVKENEGDDWVTVQSWALYQRALGRSVLFLHHSGKGGQQRGTSRREDVLDTVIALRRPGDYNPHDGAKFEVHFEKARGIFGNDVAAFEAHLTQGQDGRAVWTWRTLEESTYDKVLPLLREGMAQRDIAEELGIHKSQVSRHAKKAGELGDWTPSKKSNKRATEGATGADKRAGNDD